MRSKKFTQISHQFAKMYNCYELPREFVGCIANALQCVTFYKQKHIKTKMYFFICEGIKKESHF